MKDSTRIYDEHWQSKQFFSTHYILIYLYQSHKKNVFILNVCWYCDYYGFHLNGNAIPCCTIVAQCVLYHHRLHRHLYFCFDSGWFVCYHVCELVCIFLIVKFEIDVAKSGGDGGGTICIAVQRCLVVHLFSISLVYTLDFGVPMRQ